jgi:hypothetical protein
MLALHELVALSVNGEPLAVNRRTSLFHVKHLEGGYA